MNANGCADRVSFSINIGASESFTIDGTDFFVDIRGFETGTGIATDFWTTESQNNTATLRGVITSNPGVVPVPATLALLGLGVIALGAAGQRLATVLSWLGCLGPGA